MLDKSNGLIRMRIDLPSDQSSIQPASQSSSQSIYNCGLNCSPSVYSSDGLLHMDIETGQASLRAMQMTSLRDQRFSGRLDFSLNHRQQNRFIDQDAELVFRFDNGQQNIWRAKFTGATSIQSKPEVLGGFGAADTDRANALLGHFSTE